MFVGEAPTCRYLLFAMYTSVTKEVRGSAIRDVPGQSSELCNLGTDCHAVGGGHEGSPGRDGSSLAQVRKVVGNQTPS